MNCLICQTPLPTPTGAGRPRKVHVECVQQYTRDRLAARYCRLRGVAMRSKVCKVCKKKFVPKHGSERYCSDECRIKL